jgi:O-antigen ligase
MGALLVLTLAAAGLGALQSGLLPDQFAARLVGFASDIQIQDARGLDITPANYAVLERTAHWQAALSMADEFPWLGVGFGNYEAAYSDYALLNWPYALGHAHNYYLNLLAEAGVAGLAAYLLLWATIIWQTARVIRFASYPLRGLALGLMGAWVHLSVHHLVDKLYVNNIYLHLGALIGILILLQRDAHLVGAAGSATSLDAEETRLLPGSWLPAEEYADPN